MDQTTTGIGNAAKARDSPLYNNIIIVVGTGDEVIAVMYEMILLTDIILNFRTAYVSSVYIRG